MIVSTLEALLYELLNTERIATVQRKQFNCRTWSGFSSEIETMVMARSGSSLSSERTRVMLT